MHVHGANAASASTTDASGYLYSYNLSLLQYAALLHLPLLLLLTSLSQLGSLRQVQLKRSVLMEHQLIKQQVETFWMIVVKISSHAWIVM